MGHANIICGQLVNDDFESTAGPEFEAPTPRTFADQISRLLEQRDYVSPGWLRIFDQTVTRLKAVNCTKRDGIEIGGIAFGRGEMLMEAYGAGSDRVVHGILNRMRQSSGSTCACCGRRYGASYRRDCVQTLCERCHVYTQLEHALQDILEGASNYAQVPLIEWDALPVNIQLIIPLEKIKVVHLQTLDLNMRYVEPETLQQQRHELVLMKQALNAARGW
ncbi:MAG: hypothetical protein QUV35_08065 [Hydrogenophaga sp.]|uniref:hypothetical protein n=1 Tax=Hydrogenophaga sp. TaxID=1904254 RepID=UPI00261E0374|nr:hypothetical protein [Hydrogenophaga sp.]MDM7942569.1 hypothetical protein [Hydrogenophaga sp.]